MTIPFWIDPNAAGVPGIQGLKDMPDIPISLEELRHEFCRQTRQPYPLKGATFASSWMIFRVGAPSAALYSYLCSISCLSLFKVLLLDTRFDRPLRRKRPLKEQHSYTLAS